MRSPRSLHQLIAFLESHPRCQITDLDGRIHPVGFEKAADGGLWFREEDDPGSLAYLPIKCGVKPEADMAETGLDLDDAGFSMTKFGRTLRVDYLPPQEAADA